LTEILATAPGRCGIIGNPTDMYGGSVISCTTRERAACRLRLTASGAITIENAGEEVVLTSREQLSLVGDKIDIARAALIYFDIDPARHGFSLELSTAIPMRAGLAGSTALLAAIVGALDAYLGLNQHTYALAETTRKVEARIMQVVCGHQDQHMAVFGGLNFMDFAGKESLEQRPEEPYATIEPLGVIVGQPPLLLAHTGVQHHSGTVHRSPRERWLAGETLVRESYTRIAQLGRLGKRAIIDGDWQGLGRLMAENHALVAQLGGSGPANEQLIAAARNAGAWGAKLAGAGGGGTILVLTDEPERLAAALTAAGAERILIPGPQPGLTITSR
jgi:galactokinase/mevalonate kinase-like predicted kinase